MQRTLKVNAKLLPFLTKSQPIKVAIGGRGSGKSIGVCDMAIARMERERIDVYCLREFQESIQDSIHRTLSRSITERLELPGWDIQETKIISPHGNRTTYKGAARNVNNIQGAEDYRLSIFSEAHTASQSSIDKLLPTILRKPGAQCWFEANPQSSADPFSQRFITPYLDAIERDGFYEDELHYIVKVNWRDNPWWNEEQERLRSWDEQNLPDSKYRWIWDGGFNDQVENSIILPEWFNAAIDAHVKLGFSPTGAEVVCLDPSDEGADAKGVTVRRGSVIVDCQAVYDVDAFIGTKIACDIARERKSDHFVWDGDGMGATLRDHVTRYLAGVKIQTSMFRGSGEVHLPDAVYNWQNRGAGTRNNKTNRDTFYNRRAQYYWRLRDRFYNTYRAVVFGEYMNPDEMISLSSSIKDIDVLRSEVCRIPLKSNNNGKIQIMPKKEMKEKLKISSPNMADSLMMSLDIPDIIVQTNAYRPQPLRRLPR